MTVTATAPPARTSAPTDLHRWTMFAVRRAGRLLISLWVLVTAAFLMVRLIPGDPVRAALGPNASPEVVEARRAALGLDQPLPTQYWDYLSGVLTGNLGTSITSQIPVADTIAQRLPATLSLAVLAFAGAILVAVPMGVLMAIATRRGRRPRTELGFTSTIIFVASIPDFLLGVAIVWVFGVTLGLLPVAGRDGPESYLLPVIALALGPAAILSRIVRVEMMTVLDADFVRTARAKRLRPWKVYLGHALPNAITASLTIGGLILTSLVAGTVLVENVFAWPGLGSTIVQAIQMKDYAVVQGIVLVYGIGVLLVNTLIDAALAVLDPRTTIANA